MSEFKDKFARKFLRRSSTQTSDPASADPRRGSQNSPKQRPSIPRLGRTPSRYQTSTGGSSGPGSPGIGADHPSSPSSRPGTAGNVSRAENYAQRRVAPTLILQEPSPDLEPVDTIPASLDAQTRRNQPLPPPTPISRPTSPNSRNSQSTERGPLSKISEAQGIIDTPPTFQGKPVEEDTPKKDYFGPVATQSQGKMGRRKVWIKRAGASATSVQLQGDDLVDDVRDMVLRKYGNSLGRTWDAPDVSIRIVPRERSQQERILGPEEPIWHLLDAYYPGGQTVEEALLVEVPRRRTPQPSPRILYAPNTHYEDNRPLENGTEYFPPMPAAATGATPHPSSESRHPHPTLPPHAVPHSINILQTGQLPVLPSPRERRGPHPRPMAKRTHTSSPTFISTNGQVPSDGQRHPQRPPHTTRGSVPAPPPLPTPPAHDASKALSTKATTPPIEQVSSPRGPNRRRKNKQSVSEGRPQEHGEERRPSNAPAFLSLIEATVPPINVLIVEDNPINLRLLEMFTKRLKVRWSSAMNGRDAVVKWRTGGFHLVLMDIQLPIMSGLEATKEIRRLERVNGIGVFAKGEGEGGNGEKTGDGDTESIESNDKLGGDGIFKSPVIIVALTASSLQSDRHEALAAGCNDFLTKPVHFPWLERKIMEWGCMQALIDFDGWRKWKDLAAAAEAEKQRAEDMDPAAKAKREKKEARKAAIMAKMGQQA